MSTLNTVVESTDFCSARAADAPKVERLLDTVDSGYLAFASLRGSLSDTDRLAAEAAWVCWRTRRLLIGRTGQRSLARGVALRVRAALHATVLRVFSRPQDDIALADAVQRFTERAGRELAADRKLFRRDWESQALDRRLDELRRLGVRAQHVHACLQRQETPLWQQFLPRSS
jgi:hypothetical protein